MKSYSMNLVTAYIDSELLKTYSVTEIIACASDRTELDRFSDKEEAIKAAEAKGTGIIITEGAKTLIKAFVINPISIDVSGYTDPMDTALEEEIYISPCEETTAQRVQFEAGEGRHFKGGVNYLRSVDGMLYAECSVPEGATEDYGYMALKVALMKAVKAAGGDPDRIVFWYDGQEKYLAMDACEECEVWTEIEEG